MSRRARRMPTSPEDLGTGENAEKFPADTAIPFDVILGRQTGEGEEVMVGGGWGGSDDDTSTAPSDQMGMPKMDELAELTGGAISDEDPVIEGGFESNESKEEMRVAIADVDDQEGSERIQS